MLSPVAIVGSPAVFGFPVSQLVASPSIQHRFALSMNSPSQIPLELSCTEVRGQLDREEEFLLLDCREEAEFAHVRIEGATLLPMSEIQQRSGEIEEWKGRPVVVYCHHGGRSLQVTHWLRQQGWEQAQSMAGGIDVWAVEIDPSLPRY